jgi:hypothetical protein
LEYGLYPDRLTIGAYECAAIVGDPELGHVYSSVDRYPLVLRLLETFPSAAVLSITLHSVVNLFGYYYFERGRLLRAYAGSADEGVMVDQGDLQPEEKPFFARSKVRDGERFFLADINGQENEFDAPSFGESLVFEMTAKFFGCTLDRFDAWDLKMEQFERKKKPWWNYLVGGAAS